MLPDCYQCNIPKVRQLRTGEDVAQAFLDTYRSTWKLGEEPIPPEHPEVLSRRPGILVAVKAGVSTKKYETPQVCVFEFHKIHVGIVSMLE